MPVTAPDLNTYLVMQMECLGRIARVIGLSGEADDWEQRAQAHLQRMIAYLWDEKAGLFRAKRKGETIPVLTPFNLFPLITGRLPDEIAARLVEHLTDPAEFWTKYPIPSVAVNDPLYNPMQMWRGPTWINVNYMMVEGLERSGYPVVARELRRRTLDLVMQHSDIYEFYHRNPPNPAPMPPPCSDGLRPCSLTLALDASRDTQIP